MKALIILLGIMNVIQAHGPTSYHCQPDNKCAKCYSIVCSSYSCQMCTTGHMTVSCPSSSSCCCTTAGCAWTLSAKSGWNTPSTTYTYDHTPGDSNNYQILGITKILSQAQNGCLTCSIRDVSSLHNEVGHDYDNQSLLGIGSTTGIATFKKHTAFYLRFKIRCQHDKSQVDIGHFEVHVKCGTQSTSVVLPTNLGIQEWILDMDGPNPYYQFAGFQNNNPKCKIHQYQATCGYPSDVTCTNGIDDVANNAQATSNRIYLKPAKKLTKGDYKFYLKVIVNPGTPHHTLRVNYEITLRLKCGPDSVEFQIDPSFTDSLNVSPQSVFAQDPVTDQVYKMPVPPLIWKTIDSVKTTTTECPITVLEVKDTSGGTSLEFQPTAVINGGNIEISLKPAYQSVRGGPYKFRLDLTAEGGKQASLYGSLEIKCSVVTVSDPIDLVVQKTYTVGPPGDIQYYDWSEFIVSFSGCPPTQYDIVDQNNAGGTTPSEITYPKPTGCTSSPCRSLEIATNPMRADLVVYIKIYVDAQEFYSAPITFKYACSVHATTVTAPAIVLTQYSGVSGAYFKFPPFISTQPLCGIQSYFVSSVKDTVSDTVTPHASLVAAPAFVSSCNCYRVATTVTQQITHWFWLKVVAEGGALLWSDKLTLEVGCDPYVSIFLYDDFLLTKNVIINSANNMYEILGFNSESFICTIAKYEIFDISSGAGVAYPHTDGSACSPVSMSPPVCQGSCPSSQTYANPPYNLPQCVLPASPIITTEGSTACSSLPAPACNKVQITEQDEVTFTFRVRAYLGLSTSSVNNANYLESPTVTVQTVCGTPSTIITSQIGSTSHSILNGDTIEILLDQGTSGLFDVLLTKMPNSNQHCPIIKYEISQWQASYSAYTASGRTINQPVIQPDPDPNYSITVQTDLLFTYSFYIWATAKGLAQNANPPHLKIKIVCGSETVSHSYSDPGLTIVKTPSGDDAIEIVVQRKKDESEANKVIDFFQADLLLDQLQIVFITSKLQCPVTKFRAFRSYDGVTLSDKILTQGSTALVADATDRFRMHYESNPDMQTQLQVFNKDPIFQILFIQGRTEGEIKDIVRVQLIVCGFEIIKLKEESPHLLWFYPSTTETWKTLSWKTIDEFFIYDKGLLSSDKCKSADTFLYQDPDFKVEFPADSQQVKTEALNPGEIDVKVNVRQGFPELTIYLTRVSLGLVKTPKILKVEVCGHEKVELVDPKSKLTLRYGFGADDANPVPLSSFEDLLKVNSNFCKVTQYSLVYSSGVRYDRKNILMNDQDFSLSFDLENDYWTTSVQIKAETLFGDKPGFLPLDVRIVAPSEEDTVGNKINQAPQFEEVPNDVKIEVSNTTSLTSVIQLGNIIDNNDEDPYEKLEIEVTDIGRVQYNRSSKSMKFSSQNIDGIKLSFDPEKNTLKIEYPSQTLMQGSKIVKFTLTDRRRKSSQSEFNVDYYKATDLSSLQGDKVELQRNQSIDYSITSRIKSINQYGRVVVKFSSLMRTDMVNLTHLNSTYLDLYIDPSNNWIAYEEFNLSKLNFTWNVTRFERDEMHFQLNFTSPSSISKKKDQDRLVIHIKNPSYFFQGKQNPNQQLSPMFYVMRSKVRRQTFETERFKGIVSMTVSTKSVLKGQIVGSFVMNIFIAGSLSQLLAFINPLQLILHLPIMNVSVPSNLITLFTVLIPIVMFDVLEGVDFIEGIFPKQDDQEQSHVMDQVQQLGYETPNIILNLGTLYVLMVFYFLKVGFLLLVVLPIVKLTGKCKSLKSKIHEQVFFREFIYLFSEGYIEYLLSGMISLSIQPGSVYDMLIIHFTTAFVNTICCLVIPSIVVYVLCQKLERIRSSEFKKLWEAAYDGINLNRGKGQLFYQFFFIVRRIIFVMISFQLQDFGAIQIQILLYLSTAQMIFQGYFKPLDSKFANSIELFNEVCIYLCSLSLICFTEFLPDYDVQTQIGWLMFGVICLNMLINLLLYFKWILWSLRLVILKYYLRLKSKHEARKRRIQEEQRRTMERQQAEIRQQLETEKLQELEMKSLILANLVKKPAIRELDVIEEEKEAIENPITKIAQTGPRRVIYNLKFDGVDQYGLPKPVRAKTRIKMVRDSKSGKLVPVEVPWITEKKQEEEEEDSRSEFVSSEDDFNPNYVINQ